MGKKFIFRGLLLILIIGMLVTGCRKNDIDPPQDIEDPDDLGTIDGEDILDPDDNEDDDNDNEDDNNEDDGSLHNLDLEEDILNSSSITVLANKQYSLEEDYVPENLVTVEVPTVLENPEVKQMRKEAADALKEMFDAASEEGIILHARSGYRSYQTQSYLFESHVNNHGEEAANKFSARPGQSEHQTGLAMDVTSESVNYKLSESFEDTEEGIWIAENAHRFGFILRYPKDKTDITGYIYEPWHFRYIGVEHARNVYENDITLEEYFLGDN